MANTYVLISKSQITSNTSSVTFSSIPQTYDNLEIIWSARSTQTADNISTSYLSLNGLSPTFAFLTTYVWQSGTIFADSSSSTVLSCYFGAAGNGKPAGVYSVNWVEIPQYRNTAYKRTISVLGGCSNSSGSSVGGCGFTSSSVDLSPAITSITLTDVAGQYMSGSNFYLYGIKNT